MAVTPQATHEAIERLQVRLYKVTTRSHLRIGAGEGSTSLAATDNPVIQALFYTPPANGKAADEERVIYLPGSSLHGVIRAWAEKIHRSRQPFLTREQLETALNQLQDKRETWLSAARSEVGDYLGRELKATPADDDLLYQHWRVHPIVCNPLSLLDQCQRFGQAAEGQELPAKQEWLAQLAGHGRQNPCPICQVFGYVGQRGRVRLQHAFPAQGGTPLDVITRVAINRISGAADEGKLFDVEAVPPGAVFYFFVVLENLNDAQQRTFDAGMQALQLQLATLGAHSTVGFGVVEMERVLKAEVQPALFERTDLPAQVRALAAVATHCPGAELLDGRYYPSFYRALATTDASGKPPALFNGLVNITYGEA